MRELLEAVEGYRDRMVDLTKQLVSMATENPPGNGYDECAGFLHQHLLELGFDQTAREGDCVLSFLGNGPRTLYFHGHYDVVPAQSPAQFQPYVKGPNLFGRGSSDMKSGLAAMIYAARAIGDCGIALKGRIGIVCVPDEETAGEHGSRYLASRDLLGQDAIGMLTPEPTGGVVWNANRGAITLRVTIKGRSAHVGRQHEGINAFERMLPVAQGLMALKSEVEPQSILMLGGRAEGGSNFNTVPSSFSFTLDRRTNPDENFDEQKRRLFAIFDDARARGIDLEVETLQEGRSCGVPEDGPLASSLARNIEQVTGSPSKFEMCPGLLEIRFYAERGVPAFAYGPGLLTVSHGPNEFVPVDGIVRCAQIYALTAVECLGVGLFPGTP